MVSRKIWPLQMTQEFEDFLNQWKKALHPRQTWERTYWEGQAAYAELKRLDCLESVCLDDQAYFRDIVQWHALPKICIAVKAYRRDLKQVRHLIEQQKNHQDWLCIQSRKFRKKAGLLSAADASLAHDLQRIARYIDQTKRGTRLRLKQRWEHDLGIVHPIGGHTSLQQERQLDSQFQVRLGAILRTFMARDPIPSDKEARGPSLRTLARLIVLFLVCADLAEVRDGKARLKHNNRLVTVEGVLQQLRGAKIS
jgi:hypothetical protein